MVPTTPGYPPGYTHTSKHPWVCPARRTQCKNNMKQLGVALHNYHEIHLIFPPAAFTWRRSNGQFSSHRERCNEYGPSWMVMILPMMEQSNVYKLWRFDRNARNNANRAARRTWIKSYNCPSDVFATVGNPWTRCSGNWARTSYAANGGRLTGGSRKAVVSTCHVSSHH